MRLAGNYLKMATILDVGPLTYFTPVFVFLLVFVVFYATLLKTKILGENQGLISLAAFVVALLFVITSTATEFITLITPWFVVLLIVSMCFILIFMFVGIKPEAIAGAVSERGTVWTILIILLVLLGVALTKVIGPSVAAITQGEGGAEGNWMGTIGTIVFHPKILGALFILIVAAYAVKSISHSM